MFSSSVILLVFKNWKIASRLPFLARCVSVFTLLSVEHELLRNIDLSSLINDFAIQKSRKHNVYKASAD